MSEDPTSSEAVPEPDNIELTRIHIYHLLSNPENRVVLVTPAWVNRVPLELNVSANEYGGYSYVLEGKD